MESLRGSGVADDEGVAGGLDGVACDDRQVVDVQDEFDLDEKAVHEAEVAAGDASDVGDGLGIGEVAEVAAVSSGTSACRSRSCQ